MRVNTGRHWTDLGPASSQYGITGHHGALGIGLEAVSVTGMPQSSGTFRCAVCGDRCLPGRYACSAEHQKIAYGDRGFRRG